MLHVLIVLFLILLGVPALMGAVFLIGRSNTAEHRSADWYIQKEFGGVLLAAIVIAAFALCSWLIEKIW